MNVPLEEFLRKYPGFNGDCGIQRPQPAEIPVRYYHGKRDLFYVNVGANDGIAWDNTLMLEDFYGWSGICIEPNKYLFEQLTKNRSSDKNKFYDCACASSEGIAKFYEIDTGANGLSRLASCVDAASEERIQKELIIHGSKLKKTDVSCLTLNSILKDNNIQHVDYLSIDCEGHELEILRGLDLRNYSVGLISCENNDEGGVANYLAEFGYRKFITACADSFYEKVK